jgi:hypothetical protein
VFGCELDELVNSDTVAEVSQASKPINVAAPRVSVRL